MTKLTAIVLTYNEADHIVDCLETLDFADERVVFDSHSTDDTLQLARQAGARVIQHPFENYAQQRNDAIEAVQANTDYILFVDADERVTPELAEEIRLVITQGGDAAWRIPRYNYLFGKLTKSAGWYPDYQLRLLRAGKAHYDPQRKVHEVLLLDGDEGTLNQHLIHYNYTDVRQFRQKQRDYARLEAQILDEQGIQPRPHTYILQPLRQFWWRYVDLGGYREGWHGLRLSVLMGWYELRKYQFLRARQQDPAPEQ